MVKLASEFGAGGKMPEMKKAAEDRGLLICPCGREADKPCRRRSDEPLIGGKV